MVKHIADAMIDEDLEKAKVGRKSNITNITKS